MPRTRHKHVVLLLAPLLAQPTTALADGEALFSENCQVCHTLSSSEPRRQGPPLNGVVGRIAGSVEDFPYSHGLAQADWPWTEETLLAWLENPQALIPDSYMLFKEHDAGVRREIVDFLGRTEGD